MFRIEFTMDLSNEQPSDASSRTFPILFRLYQLVFVLFF